MRRKEREREVGQRKKIRKFSIKFKTNLFVQEIQNCMFHLFIVILPPRIATPDSISDLINKTRSEPFLKYKDMFI